MPHCRFISGCWKFLKVALVLLNGSEIILVGDHWIEK